MERHSVGRLADIIAQLENLHKDAQEIFNAYVDELRCRHPHESFGNLKFRKIASPAGSTLDYIAALKIVREKITAA